MSLIKEIEKLMNSAYASSDYRIINLGGHKLYIEGIKTVIGLTETEMDFQLKKQILEVFGCGLKIDYLDKNSCVIDGIINSVVTK